jgi:glyoxylase-like metal-dependent hydrolase (beta-lactamase superfamily II)
VERTSRSIVAAREEIMSIQTRRDLLAGAAALAAAAVTLPTARAAAPPVGKQAPGFYRYKVGTFEVTAILDGMRSWPLEAVRNAPKEQVSAALAAAHLDSDKVTFPYVAVVVNTGPKLIAIDAGLGEGLYAQTKGAVGQYHANLAAAGIDRNAIDMVIISHFHADHVNGLLTADNKPAFPNAEILVPTAERAFWFDDTNMSKAPAGSILETNFKNNRRVFAALGQQLTHYEPGKELVSGITAIATPGHTPGHVSHVLASGSAQLLVQSDVTLLPALFLRNPGWHPMFDFDPAQAEETRRKICDMAVADK